MSDVKLMQREGEENSLFSKLQAESNKLPYKERISGSTIYDTLILIGPGSTNQHFPALSDSIKFCREVMKAKLLPTFQGVLIQFIEIPSFQGRTQHLVLIPKWRNCFLCHQKNCQ